MKKIHFVFDRTIKSQKLKKILLKKFKNHSASLCDYLVIAGGDGFMLQNIRKYYKLNKPFYGINCGTFGFLMNKFNNENFYKKIISSKKSIINPLKIRIVYKNNYKKNLFAINEISLFRQSKQTAFLSFKVGAKEIIKKLIGDGILVSTPAGSTAYNLSVSGPILSLNSEKLAITPISPFRPRRWKGKIISNKSQITISNLDSRKRPVAAVADNVEVRDVRKLIVLINKKIKICLLHDKNKSLMKRIKLEQNRKK